MGGQDSHEDRPAFPDPHPVVGHTLHFLRDTKGLYESCIELDRDVVGMTVGGDRFQFLTDPSLVETVLYDRDDQFQKSSWVADNMAALWGDALIIRSGERQRRQRKRLQSLFTRSRLESAVETVTSRVEDVLADWDHDSTVRLDHQMQRLSLEILWRFLFETPLSDRRARDVVEAFRDVAAKYNFGSVQAFLPTWIPTETNRRYAAATDYIDEVVDDIYRTAESSYPASDSNPVGLVGRLRSDLEPGAPDLSPAVIKDEIRTFLFEHRTMANHLAFTLALLAANPDQQKRLRSDIDTHTSSDQSNFGSLVKAPYIRGVTRESLRLYPTVHTLFREPKEQVRLAGQQFGRDAIIGLPAYVLHRDGDLYDNPDAFDPDRWVDGTAGDLPEGAYFPFGGGRYHCIGMRITQLTTAVVLATLVDRYELRAASAPLDELVFGAHLEPAQELSATVVERAN